MVDSNIMKQLYEPFTLRSRKGVGNQQFKYVPSSDVIDRMNKVFMGQWTTQVVTSERIEDFVLVHVRVTADTDTGHIMHDGYGSSPIARFNSGPKSGKVIDVGNAYKSALSTAIRNACTRFGVGLYLEEDRWEEGPDADISAPMYKESGAVPPTLNESPAPPTPAEVGQSSTPPPSDPASSTAGQSVPPSTPPPSGGTPSTPPPVPPTAATASSGPAGPTPAPPQPSAPPSSSHTGNSGMPKIPSPVGGSTPPSPTPPPAPNGTSATTAAADGPTKKITDVQMAALDALLTLRDIDYIELVKGAFEANGIPSDVIPEKENLDYKQAVAVVSYGNHLYRK